MKHQQVHKYNCNSFITVAVILIKERFYFIDFFDI